MYQRFWDFLHIKVSNNSSCGRRKRVGKGCHYSLTTPQCHMIQPEKSCTLANLWRMWSPNMQLDIELELSSCGSWQPLKKVHIHHITNILRLSSSQVRRGRSEGQKVHSKSSTHVIEASGGPKDSLNIACPLSVSHCISISLTGEQDLQPIQWHLVLTLADNTQHHLVMEWCRGQGWSWSCGGDSVGGCPDIQALATLSPLAGTLAPALRPHHQHTLAPSHTRPLCSASSPSPLILHWALFQAGPIFDIPSWYPGFTPNQT